MYMSDKKKFAVILSGGGMSCVFTAGVLLGLAKYDKKYEFIRKPDILIAGSGSVGTASYFLAEQYINIKKAWLNSLSTKKFIDFKRFKKIVDIDYLVDYVFKEKLPLRAEKLDEMNTDYYISVTNANTGLVEYIRPDSSNIYELIRATKAMPVFYGKNVSINGNDYVDSINSSLDELKVKKAEELGATDILVVKPHAKKYDLSKFICDYWMMFKPKKFRENYFYEREIRMNYKPNSRVYTINPKTELVTDILTTDIYKLQRSYDRGYNFNFIGLDDFLNNI